MRVLVTGFGPFPGVSENPSALAVEEVTRRADSGELGASLPGVELVTQVLDVELTRIGPRIQELVAELRPDLVLCTGVDAGAECLTVERVAINLIDARVVDAAGNQPTDVPVIEGGPDGLFATIPVKAVNRAINDAGIPSVLSLSAGTYGCNEAMYAAVHTGVPAGFVHVPNVEVVAPERVATALIAAVGAAVRGEELDEIGGEIA